MDPQPLAHGWTLEDRAQAAAELVAGYIAPAAAAVPAALAARLGSCRIILEGELAGGGDLTSHSRVAEGVLVITLAISSAEPHDIALELLFCLGQATWDFATVPEQTGWLSLLRAELDAGVAGEIDEDALEEKRRLLASRVLARSPRRLERYAAVSFASSLAEFVHALWHDVTIRTGREHLPASWLRRRFEFLAGLFPPDPGQQPALL